MNALTKQDKKTPPTKSTLVYTPRSDIYEKDNGYVLLADMPGVSEKSIEAEIDNNKLTIFGRVDNEDLGRSNLTYSEFRPGSYRRSFALSEDIDTTRIQATMNNGVLKVVLPLKEAVKPQKIKVKYL